MNLNNAEQCIDAERIPEVHVDSIAEFVLDMGRDAFMNPKIVKEFEIWEERREKSNE